mmetsp:Transcript_95183/g.199031  ORF Transcript_95183/g.199031 Transcript_95183/m.199031 type:complete len:230 (+) Transcript_95183:1069-1758(+)
MHHFDGLLVLFEDDFCRTRRLQDSSSGLLVGEHLDDFLIDLRIQDNPRSASKLAVRRDVDGHGMLVVHESVHDHGAVLQHLREHVSRASGEASPVGKDHERQALTPVEVANGLGRLVGGVWVPHLASLHLNDISGGWFLGVSRDVLLATASLDGDDADRQASAAPAADDNGLAPTGHVLVEGAFVAPARHPLAIDLDSAQHVSRVVGALDGFELHSSRDGVDAGDDGRH